MQIATRAIGEGAFIRRLSDPRATPDAVLPPLPQMSEFVHRSADRQDIFLRSAIDNGVSAVFGRFRLGRPVRVHLHPGPQLLLTFFMTGDISGEIIGQRPGSLGFRNGHAHLRAPNAGGGFIVHLPAGPASFLQIRLTPSALARLVHDLAIDLDGQTTVLLGSDDGRVLANRPWSSRERAILDGFQPWETSERMMLSALSGRGAELVCAFLRRSAQSGAGLAGRNGAAGALQNLLEFNAGRPAPTRLKAIEAATGYARSTLWRASKARHGDAPARIMRLQRLDKALVDLQSTDRTVLAVALDAGWACPSKFARAFRGRFGFSPSAARHGASAR
ncbi:helix-turn-helix transcriptional regulator [Phreatobacter stygius]|uniref:Helix-turn-helix domain-containing protein n=1 Tax=Phreatobacter stygius TaxID=1940610 RepID=A0A4D7B9M6_9HYPH|nr:helix-turn-helix domain-containing protein [Phreatobacter stygius]QCI64732.1 helix-turn-helix domain-containing protein [Phreatobacter stygius]